MRKTFIKYMIPSVVSMWVFSVYTMTDGIFVARYVGESALAAVNLSMPYINAIFALSLLFSVGTSTVVAILLGQGKKEEANKVFTLNFIVLCAISAAIILITHANLDSIAVFLGGEGNTLALVKSYLGIIVLFSGFFIISYCLEVLIKTDGFPILATLGVAASAICNVVLDYIFIAKLHWGIAGAGWATGISQLLLAVLFIIHFLKHRGNLRFTRPEFNLRIYKRVLPLGLSDFSTELSTGVVIFMFNFVILRSLGEAGVVTYTIINYVNTFVLMTMIGISQGMQPLVSYHYGKGDRLACRKFFRFALVSVSAISVLSLLICGLMTNTVVSVFLPDATPEFFQYSATALRVFSLSFLVVGFNVIFSGFFTAVEQPRYAMPISLGRGLVFIALSLLIMTQLLGDRGIWLATAVSELFCLGLSLFFMKRTDFFRIADAEAEAAAKVQAEAAAAAKAKVELTCQ